MKTEKKEGEGSENASRSDNKKKSHNGTYIWIKNKEENIKRK